MESLCSVLKTAGYKVGKFISPYLTKFNEYIQINDEQIADEDVVRYIEILKPLIAQAGDKGWEVKYWEVLTAMAFMHFAKNKVDIAIIEVGVGGTWDCTNVITPLVSIITKTHYDHRELVGHTLEQIAQHDAGIIKAGVPVVTSNFSTALKVIEKRARELKSPVVRVMAKDVETSNYRLVQPMSVKYKFREYHTALKGRHQGVNLALVIEAIDILKNENFTITDEHIKQGLANVIHRARFEILSKKPLVIFDGAHNPDSVRVFMQMVDDYVPPKLRYRIYIFSILKSKDIEMIMEEFSKRLGRNSEIIFTSGTSDEFYSGKELQNAFLKFDKKQNVVPNKENWTIRWGHSETWVMDFDAALAMTKDIRRPLDQTAFFVIGSFKTYKEVLSCLR